MIDPKNLTKDQTVYIVYKDEVIEATFDNVKIAQRITTDEETWSWAKTGKDDASTPHNIQILVRPKNSKDFGGNLLFVGTNEVFAEKKEAVIFARNSLADQLTDINERAAAISEKLDKIETIMTNIEEAEKAEKAHKFCFPLPWKVQFAQGYQNEYWVVAANGSLVQSFAAERQAARLVEGANLNYKEEN